MARVGITYEQVVSAAQTLADQGADINVDSVRAVLGKGSRFLIRQYLTLWGGQSFQPGDAVEGEKSPGDTENAEEIVPESESVPEEEVGTPLAGALDQLRSVLEESASSNLAAVNQVERNLRVEIEGFGVDLAGQKAILDGLRTASEESRKKLDNMGRISTEQGTTVKSIQKRLTDVTKRSKEQSDKLDQQNALISNQQNSLQVLAERLTQAEELVASLQKQIEGIEKRHKTSADSRGKKAKKVKKDKK